MSESPIALHYFSEDSNTIGAECPQCGKILKIAKGILEETDDGFNVIQKIKCPCKEIYSAITLGNSKRNRVSSRNFGKAPTPSDDTIKCPQCLSRQITANKKGFGLAKSLGGGILLGPIGLLGGFIGSNKVKVTCLKCGYAWKP